MSTHPYHRRKRPVPRNYFRFVPNRIDLSYAHLPPYPGSLRALVEPLGSNRVSGMAQRIGLHWPPPPPISVRDLIADSRPLANSLFDARAAAAVACKVFDPASVIIEPRLGYLSDPKALLESKVYFDVAPSIFILAYKCLAAMAYADYFPDFPHVEKLRPKVSQAIMRASPGWCGTYGPYVSDQGDPKGFEGNYDFTQNFMLPIIYNYYNELTPEARERLITLLLPRGRIHRARLDDTFTSGVVPNDWFRAGRAGALLVNLTDIPETENHVLGIATARYLTNQLLYQRNPDPNYNNRRNGNTEQLLGLLRNYLRDDFAEYNAKNYQEETRHALLNLCSYAYDSEVRLGARMVLDYVSAHIAISSNDLRRMVPFRRRNEGINVQQIDREPGFMDVSLLDSHGADPMSGHFALLAGNTRSYQIRDHRDWRDGKTNRIWDWAITPEFADELTFEAISDYRLPPSIHDLFVNDLHRRFFQTLRRRPLDEPGGQRNCENMEIYSGSPSYLITAGGRPANYVIPGYAGFGYRAQNLGVALPTSFMPTGCIVSEDGTEISLNEAAQLIQISGFSDQFLGDGGAITAAVENYGVAPDFACGFDFRLPGWAQKALQKDRDDLFFIDKRSRDGQPSGFYLAIIIKQQYFMLLEAFDTWLHPEVSLEQFKEHVRRDNNAIVAPDFRLISGQEAIYTTYYRNRIHFVIWDNAEFGKTIVGSKILRVEYGTGDLADTLAEAGNDQSQFLSGTILKSQGDGLVEIHNTFLGTKITLDWRDPSHPVRISETREVEGAGNYHELWVDFDWHGPFEGDFYRPFNTIQAAVNAVADGGAIKIVPGTSDETRITHGKKRVRLVAPIGDVNIGGARIGSALGSVVGH